MMEIIAKMLTECSQRDSPPVRLQFLADIEDAVRPY